MTGRTDYDKKIYDLEVKVEKLEDKIKNLEDYTSQTEEYYPEDCFKDLMRGYEENGKGFFKSYKAYCEYYATKLPKSEIGSLVIVVKRYIDNGYSDTYDRTHTRKMRAY